ncbi:MAG: glycoside hydrolase family 36 protein [Bacteroidia bacterium]
MNTLTANDPLLDISIATTQSDAKIKLTLKSAKDGLLIYTFTYETDSPKEPDAIRLDWKLPMLNVKGIWKSGSIHDKRQQYDWELEHLRSRISVDAPIVCAFGYEDENVITFACQDAVNLVELNALLREEDNHLYCHLRLFTERHPEITQYQTEIRIDTRGHHFSEALKQTAKWYTEEPMYQHAPVPPLAREPLYSTWYQFHQELSEPILLEEFEIAKSLGYKLAIIDDGWQTRDSNRGYDYTGDWQPERMPEMRAFVDQVHALGMKIGLWFSVPFCGKKSKAYQTFSGKFLTDTHRWAPVFDPRYPEVRAHLIGLYVRAVRDWDMDALKLDFIDDFQVYEQTELTKANGRDYASVNEAVHRLMSDVMQSLRAIKPDIAIEFRQKYIGPAMMHFGNMFRAFDCPNDPVTNRIRTTDVKLLCGEAAVHSDPITWHSDDRIELAAIQLINSLYSVPQLSVNLRDTSPGFLQMIAFYTRYWAEHRSILLDGHFVPQGPLANYPLLRSKKDGHVILAIHEPMVATIETSNCIQIDVFNASMDSMLVLRNQGDSSRWELRIHNCQGHIIQERQIDLQAGLNEFSVPVAGLLKLQKTT